MMTNEDDNFRWDCIKGVRAIKDKIDAEFPTIDALFEHLIKRQQEREENNATATLKIRSPKDMGVL
jgi:hypothetical protein